MDKYEYGLKTEKIQKLVRDKDYVAATEIADTMDWSQEKNVRLLNAAAIAYEMTEKNNEAIELLLRAYECSSAGKRILYKLTELALADGNVKDAETFYKKYLEEAEGENNRYILRYRIAEAKNEAIDRKIAILEAYQRQEFEEEWACKLAELYHEAGRKEKCVKLCDEIILWFSVGPYVEKAMELKEAYEPLTREQKEHRDNREYYEAQVERVAVEMEAENAAKAKAREEEAAAAAAAAAEAAAQEKPEEAEEPAEPEVEEAPAPAPAAPTFEDEVEESAEHLANYTASVDASLIAELMEEDGLEPEEVPAPVPEAPKKMELTSEIVIPQELLDELSDDETKSGILAEESAAEKDEFDLPTIAPIVIDEDDEEEEEEQTASEPGLFSHPNCIFVNFENDDDDIVDLAIDALEAYYEKRGEDMAPLAKIVAEKLNARGLIKSLPVLEDKDLIIDQADDLTDDILSEILDIVMTMDLNKVFVLVDDPEMIEELRMRMEEMNVGFEDEPEEFVPSIRISDPYAEEAAYERDEEPEEEVDPEEEFEDDEIFEEEPEEEFVEEEAEEDEYESEEAYEEDEEIVVEEEEPEEEEYEEEEPEKEKKLSRKEKKAAKLEREANSMALLKKTFDGISPDQELSERDFIRYAEYFAREIECSIDDSGYDALEEEMDEILEDNGNLTAGDVEDIIEEAADSAEKKGLRGLFAPKYDKDGYLILRRKNFE